MIQDTPQQIDRDHSLYGIPAQKVVKMLKKEK
jgi:hypothetical protein